MTDAVGNATGFGGGNGLDGTSLTSGAVLSGDGDDGADVMVTVRDGSDAVMHYLDLDADDPVRWHQTIGAEPSPFAEYLTTSETVYAVAHDQIFAWNRETGDRRFAVTLSDVVQPHVCVDCVQLFDGSIVALTVDGTLAGYDAKDSTSVDEPAADYTAPLTTSLKGLKIGVPEAYFGEGLAPATASAVQEALLTFESLGASLVAIDLPHSNLAIAAYYVIAAAECSANLSRFDGVRYGYRCDNPENLEDLYKRSRSEGFGDEVKRRIMIGCFALSSGYYDAYYAKAQKARRLIQQDFIEAFKSVDLILGPTSPSTAFEIGTKSTDPVAMYLEDIYTTPTNLAGLPGMSIPCGVSEGKPIGLQLTGGYFREALLLNAAHQFQQATSFHLESPPNIEFE